MEEPNEQKLTDGSTGKIIGIPKYFLMWPIIKLDNSLETINLLDKPYLLIKSILK